MTPRDQLIKLYLRQGFHHAPVGFVLCKSLEEEFRKRYPDARSYEDHFNFPYRTIVDPGFSWNFDNLDMIPEQVAVDWYQFYPDGFTYEVQFDGWGIAHEENPNSMHMTRMHYPMKNFTTLEEVKAYPWPDYTRVDFSPLQLRMDEIHNKDLAVFVWMECTIWETAWYLRGMDKLMMDMAYEDEKASYIFDQITDRACYRAEIFASQGADILGLGDDIGMQNSIMMSLEMYRQWLKPRLKRVIDAAKAIKPDILVSYHSCGYIEPFIDDLIEAGVDILNPVQPECMDFKDIHQKYGDKISFSGTIGTQQLMPFGSADEVKAEVRKNLKIAGEKGGLFCCPTHMLEPEVPWANIEAYVAVCTDYRSE